MEELAPTMEALPPSTPDETEQDVDLGFVPANESNVNPPIVNAPAVTTQQPVPTDNKVCRSTCVHTQTKPYIPSMTGKKYSFATNILVAKMLDDKDEEYNQQVAYSFIGFVPLCILITPIVAGASGKLFLERGSKSHACWDCFTSTKG